MLENMKPKSSCDVGDMGIESDVVMQLETPQAENSLKMIQDSGVSPCSPMDNPLQAPVKKQTRQWEAWTRQEEENFFNALRQVGKNFDKITCRVQSKNKDQVRYYYYRLVRRMNKLLGPGFCLDAKNPQDTNAAMLRWWSLLEKYSCPASKLRLKPRRFKIFVEKLEHQLLKDRKKTRSKRSNQGDCSASPAPTIPLLSKGQTNDSCSVQLVIVDGSNTQKGRKASSLKRSLNTTGSCNKIDPNTMRTSRRRKKGALSSVAYRRWEKAAMAGVSLVADAAEQLERTDIAARGSPGPPNGQIAAHSLSSATSEGMVSHLIPDIGTQPSTKLKLQLFPIDESTRKALERDEHNPHLELTLSARKKISSVLEHLNRKWGSSTIASGELMLFPYNVQLENLASEMKWTLKDAAASAADVHASIGSPELFRLRYGWFPNCEFKSATFSSSCAFASDANGCEQCEDILNKNPQKMNALDVDGEDINADSVPISSLFSSQISKQIAESKNRDNSVRETAQVSASKVNIDLPVSAEQKADSLLCSNIENRDGMDNLKVSNGTLSAGEWADSLIANVSVGDLLTEASRARDANCAEPLVTCAQQIPYSFDSFDAAIAAHLSGCGDAPCETSHVPHASVWDAEETCDAFSFPKVTREVPCPLRSSSEACRISDEDSLGFRGLIEEFIKTGSTEDSLNVVDPKPYTHYDAQGCQYSSKDTSLADIYWPDSLGPLDLDMTPRYHGQEMILGDSTGLGAGFSRLIPSSLDAFQNCCFGSEKKESLSIEGVATQFSDFKRGEV